jgi:hypothetical protein
MILELYNKFNELSEFKIFGILLYSNENPHIIKMLRDIDYYNSLNEKSGEDLIIFHTPIQKGNYIYSSKGNSSLALMVRIWKEPEDNKKVLPIFEIKDSRELPVFTLFLFENGELHFFNNKIKYSSVEDSYLSLASVIDNIKPIYKMNTKNKLNYFKLAKRKIKINKYVKNLGSLISILSKYRGATKM